MPWTEAELERLKARYADDPGGRMHGERFARVAARVFSRGRPAGAVRRRADVPDRIVPPGGRRGAGLFRPRRGDHRRADGYRRPATGRARASGRGRCARSSGSALQPRARLRPDLRPEVADVGDVPFSGRYDLAASHRRDRGLDRGDGRAGRTAAVGRGRPLDQLPDPARGRRGSGRSGWCTSTPTPTPAGRSTGCGRTTAAPFRNAVLDGVLDPTRTIQIGLRGASEYLYEFAADSGMTVHPRRGGRRDRRRGRGREGARGVATARSMSRSTSTRSTRRSRREPARPRSAG